MNISKMFAIGFISRNLSPDFNRMKSLLFHVKDATIVIEIEYVDSLGFNNLSWFVRYVLLLKRINLHFKEVISL